MALVIRNRLDVMFAGFREIAGDDEREEAR